jgi:hypothetical protein
MMMRRIFGGMQLADWMQLSGVTGLTLRCSEDVHQGMLLAVLPRLTPLRSLVLRYQPGIWGKILTAGGRCPALLLDDPSCNFVATHCWQPKSDAVHHSPLT